MNRQSEDIHNSLLAVYNAFDTYCKQNACMYNIVSDEPNEQGFILQDRKHRNQMYDYLTPVLKQHKVAMKVEENRPDGVLFRFRLAAISDGFWKPYTGKRTDMSIFANDADARKVRAGKTMYQKTFKRRLSESLHQAINSQPLLESKESWRGKDPNDMTRTELRDYWQKEGAERFQEAGYQNYKAFILVPRLSRELLEQFSDITIEEANAEAEKIAQERVRQKLPLDVHLADLELNLDYLPHMEDQYKSPTGKHRRAQSPFRSSYSRSKTFGGVKENIAAGNIAGQMVPPAIEEPSSLGTVSAARSTSDGESEEFAAYPDRKNAVDNPTTVTPSQMEAFVRRLDERLNDTDGHDRTIATVAPEEMAQPAMPISPGGAPGAEVIPDSQSDKEAMDPTGGMQSPDMAQSQNLHPLGTNAESPYYGNHGNEPHSNVNSSGLRSFEGPTVTPLRRATDLPDINAALGESLGAQVFHFRLKKAIDQLGPYGKSPKTPSPKHINESTLARPEDAYDFMQQVVRELGLATEAKKVVLSDRTFVKACDGDLRLELENNKLSVYRRGKKIEEIQTDFRKDTVVDGIVCRLLKLLEN